MKQHSKIGIIGVYGLGSDFTTGQAVKTYTLVNWFTKQYPAEDVQLVNLYQWKKHPFRLFLNILRCVRQCDNIVFLPAQNGTKVLLPLLSTVNRLYKRRTHYIVTGGWLADYLKSSPRMIPFTKSFYGVYVQAHALKASLEGLGLQNAVFLPNCRNAVPAPDGALLSKRRERPLRVCTYSRIVESKGLKDAAEICRLANQTLGEPVFFLDMYGKVAPEYQADFDALCKEYADVAQYCGVKNAEETVAVLQPYFALLFPTYYEGECFAGTALDAFCARVPMIANDWKYNGEVIDNEKNGFLYPFRDVNAAADMLVRLYKSENLYQQIMEGCGESAERFDTDRVMGDFARHLI